MPLKTTLARKAVKTTAKHTARGTVSKLKREPMRTSTLVGLGAVLGAAVVWVVGKLGGGSDHDHFGGPPTAAA